MDNTPLYRRIIDGRATVPTEADIRAFGKSIGIVFPPLDPRYPEVGDALHELGHWAVIPDFVIEVWKSPKWRDSEEAVNRPGAIPNSIWFYEHYWRDNLLDYTRHGCHFCWESVDGKAHLASLYYPYYNLGLPDEWGVREWCGQIKDKMSWNVATRQNDYLWEEAAPYAKQLSDVGIDIANGIYRPTVTRIEFEVNGWAYYNHDKLLRKTILDPEFCRLLTLEEYEARQTKLT
jgi:hypothetical protein